MKSHLSVGYAVGMSSKVERAASGRGMVAALLAFSCLTSGGAALAGGALPSGGQFVAGAGAISATANGLSISQSGSHGIINWQNFSIGQGDTVNIANGLGATLNRVTGGNISSIAGSLTSTGSVYLVNPAGVIVLPSGQVVTTGSFVASTRDVSNSSFLAGGALDFTGTSSGAVVNQGSITSSNGDVVLIGQSVTNTGQISAPNGTAALAAGDDVLLQAGGDPTVLINAGTGDVTNSGSIAAAQAELAAAGGNVYALATNNGGAIRATGTTTKNGHVYLTSTDGDVTVDSAVSATNADGSGGAIVATGGSATGSVTVNGSLNASATGKTAKGGSVTVTASSVAIASTAAVSANGGSSGGAVLIGGDRHGGSDPSQDFSSTPVANALTTSVAAGAQISANGGTGGGSGNGGNVVVWSDQSTSFAGSIAARGGAAGGNGGFVEVSGKQTLAFTGLVDTSAPLGLTGTLLLDPANVTISTSPTSGDSITGGTYSPNSGVATSNINNGDLDNQLANNNVLVTTTNSGTSGGGTGNITVSAPVAWNSTHSLTLNAAGVISFTNNTDSIINSGTGGITLIAGGAGLPLTASGTPGLTAGVPIGAAITVGFDPQTIGETFTPVLSSGGAITITATNGDISVSGPISASGSGAITLTAAGIISFGSAADPLTATGSGGISLTASGADVTNLGSAAIAIGANITAAGGAISIVSTTAVPAGNGDGNGSGSGFGGNIISSSEVGYGTAAIGYQITMGNQYSITNTQANGAGAITLQADQVRLGTGVSPGATVTTPGQVNILPTSPGNTGSSSAVYLGDTDTGGAFYNPDNVTLIPGEQIENVTANLIVIGNSSTTAISLVNPSGEGAPRFEAGNASNLKLVTGPSGSVTQDANSPIIVSDGYGSLASGTGNGGANGIGTGGLAISTGGAITLNNPYNSVGTIAFSSTGGGNIAFTRQGDNVNGNPGSNLVVGTVGGVSGVNTTGTFILRANETDSSTSSGVSVGALTVTQDDTSAANAVKVGSLLLEGPISSFTLDNLSNQIATVAASVQTMTLVDNTALATGSLTDPNTATTYNGISAAGAVTIVANASFTIASGDPIATTSGNVMIEDGSSGGAGTAAGGAVAANTGFVNNDGTAAFAVTGGGTWRVYSQDPRDDSKGGLTATQYNFVQYAAPNTYGAPSAATTFSNATADINASASGNGFIYTVAPTVAATISTTLTRVYDGDTDYPGTGTTPISYTKGAVTVGGNTVTNLGTGGTADTVTISNTTITLPLASGFYPSKNVGTYTVTIPTTSPTTPTYTTKDANNVTIYGYVLNPSHSATASITPAPLTVSGSRYYNGGTSTAPATLAVSGTTYGGDSFTVSGAGSVASANASVTPQNIATSSGVVTGLSLVGTDSSNYQIVSGTLTINPEPLTITASTQSRSYGSTAGLVLGSGETTQYSTSGLVNNETIGSVTLTGSVAATTATTNAGTLTNAITPSGATGGTFNTSNYNISYVQGNVIINPALLTVTGTKVYDTTTGFGTSSLTATGGVNGQTVTLNAGTGTSSGADVNTYTGPNTSFSGLGITVTGGTGTDLASNYQLPTTGMLSITPAALTVTASTQSRSYGSTAGLVLGTGETIDYTTSGLLGGQTIGSVTLTGNTAATSASTNAGTLTNAITPSAAAGGTFNASDYNVSYVQGNVIINPALLTVTGTKVYDATTGFTTNQLSVAGGANGETVALTAGTGTSSGPDVNTYNGSTLSGLGISVTGGNALASNYQLPTTGMLSITPAPLTVTGTKVYDSTTGFTTNQLSVMGGVGGQTVVLTGGTGASSAPDVNTYAGSTLTGLTASVTGGSISNYQLPTTGSLSITPAALTVTASPQSRSYGSTTGLVLGTGETVDYTTSGLVGGQTIGSVTLTGNAAATSASTNAGTLTNAITPSAAAGGTFNASDYNVSYVQGNVIINPALLTVTGTKVYDATTGFTTNQLSVAGGANGETVTLTAGTGTSSGPDVNTYNGSTLSGLGISVTGGNALASNYQVPTTGTLSITPAALTVTASTQSRSYGSTTGLVLGTGETVDYTTSGLIGGQTIGSVTLAGTAAATSASTNAGTLTNAITPSAATGGTFNASDYNVSYVQGNVIINPALLTVTGTKVYDATTGFTTNQLTATGGVNGETVSLTAGTGTSSGPNVNTYAGSALSGVAASVTGGNALASNYQVPTTGTLSITPAPLTVTGTKVYDTTTGFTTSQLSVTGGVGGQTVALTGGTGTSSAPDVNTYAGSTLTGLTASVTGGSISNYQLPTTGALTITPAALTVTASPQSRTYGSTTGLVLGSGETVDYTTSGLLGGQTIGSVTLTGTAAATSATTNAGTLTNAITPSAATGGTFTPADYAITYAQGNVIINPALLTVTGTKVYDTTTGFTTTQLSVTGGVNGQTVALTGGTGTSSSPNAATYPGSPLSNLADSVTGGTGTPLASNYQLPTTGTLTITPAPVTVSGSRYYDGLTDASGSVLTVSGFPNLTATGTGAVSSPNASTTAQNLLTSGGLVTGLSLSGTGAGNYSIVSGTLLINPEPLTIGAVTQTKLYDGTTVSTNTPVLVAGALEGGTTLTNLTQAYQSRNVLGLNGSTLLVTGYTLSDPGNYTVTLQTAPGTITPEPVTVTAVPTSKPYDGTPTSPGTPAVTAGTIFGPDTGTFTQTYNTPNAGTGLTLTPTGFISDGNGGNNYIVTYVPITSGIITPQALTISAVTQTKVYDGTTVSTGIPVITAGALVGGDTLTNLAQAYQSRNVLGTNGSTLFVTSYTLSDPGNYNVTVKTTPGTITPEPLIVTAVPTSKTYDGTPTSSGTPLLTSGTIFGPDTGKFTQAYNSPNAGQTVTLTPTGVLSDGNGGNNYTVTYVPISTGVINPLPVILNGTRPFDNNTDAASSILAITNLIGGDVANVSSGTGTLVAGAVGLEQIANFGTLTLGGPSAGNYTFVGGSGDVLVTSAVATIAVPPLDQTSSGLGSTTYSFTAYSGGIVRLVPRQNGIVTGTIATVEGQNAGPDTELGCTIGGTGCIENGVGVNPTAPAQAN